MHRNGVICCQRAGASCGVQAIQRVAQWEAHQGSILALQWMQLGPVPGGAGFIASASTDKGLTLWTPAGAHVGDFGQAQPWDIDDKATWKSTAACPAINMPTFRPDLQRPAAQQQPQGVHEQADLLEAAMGSLLTEASNVSDVSAVYSSGDELLPMCFTEPDGTE